MYAFIKEGSFSLSQPRKTQKPTERKQKRHVTPFASPSTLRGPSPVAVPPGPAAARVLAIPAIRLFYQFDRPVYALCPLARKPHFLPEGFATATLRLLRWAIRAGQSRRVWRLTELLPRYKRVNVPASPTTTKGLLCNSRESASASRHTRVCLSEQERRVWRCLWRVETAHPFQPSRSSRSI